MSATNFWNNFKNGFLDGMFFNSPLFGCFGGFNGFNNWSVFGGWNCGFMGFGGSSPSLFLTPNFNAGASFQLMSDIPIPQANFNFDTSKMFNNNIWNNSQAVNMPSNFNFGSNWNNFPTTNFNWGSFGDLTYKKTSTPDEKITYDAAELKKTWSKKRKGLSDAFYNKVIQVAKNLKCSPNDLMAVMYSESGIDSKKVGRNGATGLIQFLPKYMSGLGTNAEALKKMSDVEQMNYVEKCIKASKKIAKISDSQTIDSGTLYALVYLPAYAGREILATKTNDPNGYYSSNKGLDANKDGKITKSDLATRLKNYYA